MSGTCAVAALDDEVTEGALICLNRGAWRHRLDHLGRGRRRLIRYRA